ncbi:MAG: NADH-quinone oxidoreductase subunit NuoF [SAR324 cluster bacterium]|uniref:NADH-quinone oxidoreductase subunit F n=1 Tax=SAR324 cluster bacterium TaxID=2024889 RepID=A0A7X9FRE8_9DELT|nr:NADH-quinone oxidoreductase subunit NuoF [SAR324 cluster bacterium]
MLLKNINEPDQHTLSKYESRGGYKSMRQALSMDPLKIVDEVKISGLRGRGGAGFPTGMKWSFVPRNSGRPVYLINNADESEPGTFKDRVLLERDPHLCLEGTMIAAVALGCHWAAIYIRGEYAYPYICLKAALDECYAKGYLGKKIFGTNYDLDIVIHRGAGAYICGEETGLIESLEGKKGQPRTKPPFPAVVGLYNSPTVINNVETLANLPWILQNGGKAFANIGTEKSKGTKLISVSGHIKKPGVYEVDMGYPLTQFIEDECGGMLNDHRLKAVIPGGSSVPLLRADELNGLTLDYESLKEAGSMLGSGGMMIFDETVNMLDAALNFAHFYSHESCGQCTPCREGGHWLEKILKRIKRGAGKEEDLVLMKAICSQIGGHTICPFGDALITPILSYINKFPEDFGTREREDIFRDRIN